MEQLKPDLWALGGSPSSITSFFTLTFLDGHLADRTQRFIFTGNCGLGWRFHISIADEDTEPSEAQTTFSIYFVPHLIVATNIGDLQATINAENLVQQDPDSTIVDLSTNLQSVHLASYISIENFSGEATVTINVTFATSFSLSLANEPQTGKIKRALSSYLEGELCDTKFWLFTRRGQNKGATHPQVVFADSALLHGHSTQLDSILAGQTVYRRAMVYNTPKIADGTYDYESDSDLDSDSEGDAQPAMTNKTDVVREHEKATLQMRGDEQVIVVDDIAFQTWKALVIYLYTKEISFEPLTSSRMRDTSTSDKTAACSPKSMYRLASKIDAKELRILALNAIGQDLSEDNVIEELFSRFTSIYSEVQKVEVDYLIANLTPALFEKLLHKLEEVVAGQVPHCYDILAAVMRKLHANKSAKKNIVRPITPVPHTPSFHGFQFTHVSPKMLPGQKGHDELFSPPPEAHHDRITLSPVDSDEVNWPHNLETTTKQERDSLGRKKSSKATPLSKQPRFANNKPW